MPSFTGTKANDTLVGSVGADTLTGLEGDDVYRVNQLSDVIVEKRGGGNDTLISAILDSLGVYSLARWSEVENLTYSGLLAAQLVGNGLSNVIKANAATNTADSLFGGGGNDSLYGFGGDDQLFGGIGNDFLDGGAGADVLVGGSGNDTYLLDAIADRIVEASGGGTDTLRSTVVKDLRAAGLSAVENLVFTGSTAATLHGNAAANSVVSLSSTADTLYGHGGNDTLDGGGGANVLYGGRGDDVYKVGTSDTVVELAGEGIDTLLGLATSLASMAYANTVENLIYTGTGNVALTGNALANLIVGGAGNNTLEGGAGNDSLFGGAGADVLNGGEGDDFLYGGGLVGLSASGTRIADTAIDTLAGGAGNDRYEIDNLQDTISEAPAGGSLDVVVSTIDVSLTAYPNVEALVLKAGGTAHLAKGGSGNDILVGNEGDNYLLGGLGNDTLSGHADVANSAAPQSDVLDGGPGNDVLLAFDYLTPSQPREVTLFGGSGDDLYVINAVEGSYSGSDSDGTDTAILLASGSIAELDGVENIVLWGADSANDALARAAVQRVLGAAHQGARFTGTFDLALNATGNTLANQITGNALGNLLDGGDGDDTLIGGAGDDVLIGGDGTDSLVGGAGDDWYNLDTGDSATELVGEGFDTRASATLRDSAAFAAYANFEGWQYLGDQAVNLSFAPGNTSDDLLVGGSGNDTLAGYGGQDNLRGSAGNDTLLGGADDDALFGDAGDDNLDGENGDDALEGGDGVDTLQGGAGADALSGDEGADTLQGGDGRDVLSGGDGDDLLYGENNEDELIGGGGADDLRGGSAQFAGGSTSAAHGDHLWGDEALGTGSGNADRFLFDTVTGDNGISETFTGSGIYEFINGATIGDFEPGIDLFGVAKELLGNLDTVIDSPVETTAAGEAFSSDAELVLVRADLGSLLASGRAAFFQDIDADGIAAVMGDASAPIPVGQTRLFVVDDGQNSAVFLFQSNNGDADIGLDELYLMGVVTGTAEMVAADFLLF